MWLYELILQNPKCLPFRDLPPHCNPFRTVFSMPQGRSSPFPLHSSLLPKGEGLFLPFLPALKKNPPSLPCLCFQPWEPSVNSFGAPLPNLFSDYKHCCLPWRVSVHRLSSGAPVASSAGADHSKHPF